ncbi:MAG: ATP-binding protein [Pirellulales bacterium]
MPAPSRSASSDAGDSAFLHSLHQRFPHVAAALDAEPMTQDEIEASRRQRTIEDRAAEQQRRRQAWDALVVQLGRRYADCALDTFVQSADPDIAARQQAALARLGRHAATDLGGSGGLVLYGPAGTGKDFLATAMARIAVLDHGREVLWKNGLDLWAEGRALIGDDHALSEDAFVRRLAKPDILWLSDPLPPSGALTQYQTSLLFRVVDRRYRDERPTWATLNVQDSTEAAERLSASVVDRLRDGALTIACEWPSYRRALT